LPIFEPNRYIKRLMIQYNWQQKDWPGFTYSLTGADDVLFSFTERTGHTSGMLKALPENIQMEAIIDMMVAEAIKTSEIEGEYLSRKDVFSSVKKNLGLLSKVQIRDKKAAGIGEMMADVRNTFKESLTREKLFAWHTMLMADTKETEIGKWRTHAEPMQVISGAMGKEKVHFEAPPSAAVAKEMKRFLQWFNDTAPGGRIEIKKGPVRAAVAHLYFETIHPFEDGNGRIGRAIAEKALSQGIGRPVMLSLSKTIEAAKKDYYAALQKAQRSNEISSWVNYFVRTILQAQKEAETQIDFTLKKVKFFDRFKNQLNERQLTVIKRMLDEGPEGFKGGMNARKYAGITKTSKATATRDLQFLASINALTAFGGGRSTSYQANL
jgi:Fic family protein